MAIAIILVTVVGLLGAIILVLAAKFMSVYEDPRVGQVNECLPGANCGGCGYAGCADYAKAVVENGAPVNKCAVGGAACAAAIAAVMGVEAGSSEPVHAVIHCQGQTGVCKPLYDYQGIESCAAANALYNGPKMCNYACLGLGDCVKACKFGAIEVVDGKAKVNVDKCVGCGACAAACPKKVISMMTAAVKPVVLCSSHDKGPVVMKACSAGCIGCTLCAKNCPEQAITMDNLLPVINYDKCTGCGTCVEKCPKQVIKMPADFE